METELSSPSQTFFVKRILPTVFVSLLPMWGYLVLLRHYFPIGALVGWGIATFILVFWSWPTQRVWLCGDKLLIGDRDKRVSVNVSALSGIYSEWWNRTPNLLLRFKDPTQVGRFVRIVVKWDHRKNELRRVEKLLRDAWNSQRAE